MQTARLGSYCHRHLVIVHFYSVSAQLAMQSAVLAMIDSV